MRGIGPASAAKWLLEAKCLIEPRYEVPREGKSRRGVQ